MAADKVIAKAGKIAAHEMEAAEDDIEVVTPKGKRAYMVKKLTTIHALMASENGGNK